MSRKFEDELHTLYGEHVACGEDMSAHTTFRIGGSCDYFVRPADRGQLRDTIALCEAQDVPYYIMGNGSNLLVADDGYRGVVLCIYKTMDEITVNGTVIRAGAGAMLAKVSQAARQAGLTGLEFASGIPGTIGGAVVMNAGAYGGEMQDVVTGVEVLTKEGAFITYTGEEMAFGYRTSRAMTEHCIVLSATLTLKEGNEADIKAAMDKFTEARKEKQPLEYPSAGSTFKRPEGYFAGKLIQDAGLRGYKLGGAQVSDKHCGFVINAGGATAADVRNLIAHIQDEVYRQFKVRIEPEIKFLGDFS